VELDSGLNAEAFFCLYMDFFMESGVDPSRSFISTRPTLDHGKQTIDSATAGVTKAASEYREMWVRYEE
jgi:hypothetical protein